MIGQRETIISDAPCCVYQGTTLVFEPALSEPQASRMGADMHPTDLSSRGARPTPLWRGKERAPRDLGVGLRQSGRFLGPQTSFLISLVIQIKMTAPSIA